MHLGGDGTIGVGQIHYILQRQRYITWYRGYCHGFSLANDIRRMLTRIGHDVICCGFDAGGILGFDDEK